MKTYDVAIIGSGLGGLVCGSILSKAGLRVIILEKASRPGGCIQSYRRGDHLFDTGLHYVGGLDRGQPLHGIFNHLGLLRLPWQRMDADFDHVIIGQRTYTLSSGYDRFIGTLAREFPHQLDGLRKYAEKMQHITEADLDTNAWTYLHSIFTDETLINVLSASSLKIELRKESLPLASLTHSCRSYIESSWRLKGSGRQIVDLLTQSIVNHKGEVRLGTAVNRLSRQPSGTIGVVDENGTVYRAGHVVADVHPHILMDMLDDMKGRYLLYTQRMRALKNTHGMFTASLLLAPHRIPYKNHNAFVYDSANVWESATEGHIRRVMVSLRYPEDESGYARQIDLLTPMEWSQCKDWGGTRVGQRGKAYKEMCMQKARECIRLAERFIPQLGQAVVECHTSTPLTYRDYLSAPEGNAFGTRKDCRCSMLTFHSVRTPVPNLLLTGQSVWLPGIEGVTMTAIETCRQILGTDYMNKITES